MARKGKTHVESDHASAAETAAAPGVGDPDGQVHQDVGEGAVRVDHLGPHTAGGTMPVIEHNAGEAVSDATDAQMAAAADPAGADAEAAGSGSIAAALDTGAGPEEPPPAAEGGEEGRPADAGAADADADAPGAAGDAAADQAAAIDDSPAAIEAAVMKLAPWGQFGTVADQYDALPPRSKATNAAEMAAMAVQAGLPFPCRFDPQIYDVLDQSPDIPAEALLPLMLSDVTRFRAEAAVALKATYVGMAPWVKAEQEKAAAALQPPVTERSRYEKSGLVEPVGARILDAEELARQSREMGGAPIGDVS